MTVDGKSLVKSVEVNVIKREEQHQNFKKMKE